MKNKRDQQDAHTESQSSVRRNTIDLTVSIAKFRRDNEKALASSLHASNALIPSLDHFSAAKFE